jgi:predicted MPP superfamily phosphohydrolase
MFGGLSKFLHSPNWSRQHRWRATIWGAMNRLGLTGVHGLPVSRHWVEVHRRKMPMVGLDPSFNGFKIVQISDLHYSPMVWAPYLHQYVDWVNDFQPDMVVITGDLVTGGYRWSRNVAGILERLKAPQGVICTLGNHDYSLYGRRVAHEGLRRADFLCKCLKERGLIVLRNEVLNVHRNGSRTPLVIVGLDDEWSGNIDPPRAFRNVDATHPIICLNHNPANCDELFEYPWQWMLSGHTHGRQLATSRMGSKFFGHMTRRYTHGYYPVGDRHLYVNRGLSYGQRLKRWCRPEITIFQLRAVAHAHPEAHVDHPPGYPVTSA